MKNHRRLLFVFLFWPLYVFAQNTKVIDPNDIPLGPYRHSELPTDLLKRIRVTTDAFQAIDGVTYEMAVDLYKRDINPEENLVIWESMVKAYSTFCQSRCKSNAERKDVYRALLLRSMFSEPEAISQAKPSVLSVADVRTVVRLYSLPSKPIGVVKGN